MGRDSLDEVVSRYETVIRAENAVDEQFFVCVFEKLVKVLVKIMNILVGPQKLPIRVIIFFGRCFLFFLLIFLLLFFIISFLLFLHFYFDILNLVCGEPRNLSTAGLVTLRERAKEALARRLRATFSIFFSKVRPVLLWEQF